MILIFVSNVDSVKQTCFQGKWGAFVMPGRKGIRFTDRGSQKDSQTEAPNPSALTSGVHSPHFLGY